MKALNEIRARLEAATPHPPRWRFDIGNGEVEAIPCRTTICLRPQGISIDDPNMELIAHAPTDIARLLQALEKCMEQRDIHASVYAAPDEVRFQDNAELEAILNGREVAGNETLALH